MVPSFISSLKRGIVSSTAMGLLSARVWLMRLSAIYHQGRCGDKGAEMPGD
jgi:hypothetical protein